MVIIYIGVGLLVALNGLAWWYVYYLKNKRKRKYHGLMCDNLTKAGAAIDYLDELHEYLHDYFKRLEKKI